MSSTDRRLDRRRSSGSLGTDSNPTSPSSSRPPSLPPTPPSGAESIHTEKILLAAPLQPFLPPTPPSTSESNGRVPSPSTIPRSRSFSRTTSDAEGKAVESTVASAGDEKKKDNTRDEMDMQSPSPPDPIEELLKADIPPLPTPRPPSTCPIFCCFYAQFDNVVGPKVAYQSPKGFMDQDTGISSDEVHEMLGDTFQRVQAENHRKTVGITETEENSDEDKSDYVETGGAMEDDSQEGSLSIFDATSEYIITGNELAEKMINLSTHDMHILTRPTAISDARYERNALLFSVGFVLSRKEDPRPFRPLLSKLADVLRSMEVEHHFLTDPNLRVKLQPMLDRLLVSLNSVQWECNLLLDPANALNLRAFRPSKPPASPVHDYAVPILVRENLLNLYDWDLAIHWISMFLSGVDHARLIATKSDVDMEMVRACLRVLKHHGVIALVDMFFYSNRYEFTDRASAMMAGKEPILLQEAMDYVSRLHQRSNNNTPPLGEAAPGVAAGLPSSVGRHSDTPFLPINDDVMSFPPRKTSIGSVHAGSLPSARELPRSHTSRRHPKRMKQALAELYCCCNRSISFGDLMISKLSEASSSLTTKRGGSRAPFSDGVELEGIQESMGEDTIIRLSSAESERGRSLLFPESSNLDRGKKGIDQSGSDWTEVFEFMDHRRFATFGVVHGLLRRVHSYPRAIESSGTKDVAEQPKQVSLKENENSNKQRYIFQQGSGQPTVMASRVAAMMDGTKCDDELACKFEKPIDELIEIVEASGKRKVISIYSVT